VRGEAQPEIPVFAGRQSGIEEFAFDHRGLSHDRRDGHGILSNEFGQTMPFAHGKIVRLNGTAVGVDHGSLRMNEHAVWSTVQELYLARRLCRRPGIIRIKEGDELTPCSQKPAVP
jgi:hypothetical protein